MKKKIEQLGLIDVSIS